MSLRFLSCLLLSCLLVVSSAHAAVTTYTLSGGTLTGTLNGASFVGASYTITADADASNFIPGTFGGDSLLSQTAVSTMTIVGFAPFQITSPNFGLLLADASFIAPGLGFGGFGFQADANNLPGIAALGPMPSMSGTVSVTGSLVGSQGFEFTSTAGNLIISSFSGVATFTGDFPPSAVPEPTSMAIFGLGSLGMAYRARRKLKA